MGIKMSLQSRRELLLLVQKRYQQADWCEKRKILDELIATTNYRRKYIISFFNRDEAEIIERKKSKRLYRRQYDEAVHQALLTLWYAANQICSKRLVPFIPELLPTLERFGHLFVSPEVRERLLTISSATVDRLLETTRKESRKGISTTRPGSLLKKQIKVRTFADWNDVVPGFLEGDLVAHCGDRTDGSFLNTLVLTDIASTWTEFFPLLRKSESNVIAALKVAQQILPFSLIGLDTDNGSEFINHTLLNFCKTQQITFTRSRAYKKNDQAHVEERNGSIVRRLIGYDRYEGLDAYNALSDLYATLRLYVNFFQPSLKLLSKTREGAKVTKKYDVAKTPYQRVLISEHISLEIKEKIKAQYITLDPLKLLKNLEKLQDIFWKHAWRSDINFSTSANLSAIDAIIDNEPAVINETDNIKNIVILPLKPDKVLLENNDNMKVDQCLSKFEARRYRRSSKPRKEAGPRTWRTRKDPFQNVWSGLRMQLELNPTLTAKNLLDSLINEQPGQFSMKLLRTLQRRVASWCLQQTKIRQEQNSQLSLTQGGAISSYVSLVGYAVIGDNK